MWREKYMASCVFAYPGCLLLQFVSFNVGPVKNYGQKDRRTMNNEEGTMNNVLLWEIRQKIIRTCFLFY